jgi:hypothetical protein
LSLTTPDYIWIKALYRELLCRLCRGVPADPDLEAEFSVALEQHVSDCEPWRRVVETVFAHLALCSPVRAEMMTEMKEQVLNLRHGHMSEFDFDFASFVRKFLSSFQNGENHPTLLPCVLINFHNLRELSKHMA